MSPVQIQAPALPTLEQLQAVWDELTNLSQSRIDELTSAVFEVANFDGDQEVTYEQVGQLALWLHDLEWFASEMSQQLANAREAVLRDFLGIIQDGRQTSETTFSESGRRKAS